MERPFRKTLTLGARPMGEMIGADRPLARDELGGTIQTPTVTSKARQNLIDVNDSSVKIAVGDSLVQANSIASQVNGCREQPHNAELEIGRHPSSIHTGLGRVVESTSVLGHMAALESASVDQDIKPFAKFLAEIVQQD